MAARVSAPVWALACVNPLMGLEGLFAREGSLTEATPNGALRLGSLLNERRYFLQLRSAAFLEVLHFLFVIRLPDGIFDSSVSSCDFLLSSLWFFSLAFS